MKKPLDLTVEDIAKMMAEAQELGVAINMQFIPIRKDKETNNTTEKGGAE